MTCRRCGNLCFVSDPATAEGYGRLSPLISPHRYGTAVASSSSSGPHQIDAFRARITPFEGLWRSLDVRVLGGEVPRKLVQT